MIGAELVERLRGNGVSIIALTHQRSEILLADGRRVQTSTAFSATSSGGEVVLLHCDVRQERLGLDEATYGLLADSTDLIVHCAALTDFRLDPIVYPPVNTAGTAHVIDLALVGQRPTPMIYISTAYVCGWRQGRVLETELDHAAGFVNAYEESKYKAEHLVRAAGVNGLPFIIVRPSIIVGAARTGRIREFHNIYAVLKLVTEGRIRVLPGRYDATLDLVPIDYVVSALARLVNAFDDYVGRCLHLTNGLTASLREFSDVLAEYPSMRVPRIVPPKSFDLSSLPPIERRLYLRGVRAYDGYFLNRVQFVNDTMLRLLGDMPRPPHGKQQLRRLIDYCERTGFLGGSPGPRAGAAVEEQRLHAI